MKNKPANLGRSGLIALFLLTVGGASTAPALADENMDRGIGEYQAGKYDDAISHFQMALGNDYNNPKLHYFLASAFVRINKKEAGVREYRIAYALDPDHEVGKNSKKALELLGVEGESKPVEAARPVDKKPPTDPLLDKIQAQMQAQAERDQLASKASNDSMLQDMDRRNQEMLDRAKMDAQRDSSYYRRGRLIQLPLPPEALRNLDALKSVYDQQKQANTSQIYKRSEELQKSADNLQSLLNDKSRSGPQLVPQGTSLYVRNYKETQKAEAEAAAAKKAIAK